MDKIAKNKFESLAYSRFLDSIKKTKDLLDAGGEGIEKRINDLEIVMAQMASVKGVPGPTPKGYAPKYETEKSKQISGWVNVKADKRSMSSLKNSIAKTHSLYNELHYHFNSVIAVYIWATFETYITMLFEELLFKKPQILKSNEKLLTIDVFEHKDRILDFLVEKQIEKIGHFNLKEILEYLHDKINFKFSPYINNQLKKYYLIRNIIAHNTGLIRQDLKKELPKSIRIVNNNEIRISDNFLKSMIRSIRNYATKIEDHVILKFY